MNGQRKSRRALPGVLAGAVIFLLARALPVTATTLRLDTSSTTIQFTLGATMHEVEGVFELTGGEITFDRTTGEASGRIVVSALTGYTANKKRDKKMHNEVLESSTYPEIAFVVRRLDGTLQPQGESEITLQGTIELHGSLHELAIPAVVQMENDRLSGTAQFTIPFVEWGLKDPSVFILRVKKEVLVTLNLNGTVLSGGSVAKASAAPAADDEPTASTK